MFAGLVVKWICFSNVCIKTLCRLRNLQTETIFLWKKKYLLETMNLLMCNINSRSIFYTCKKNSCFLHCITTVKGSSFIQLDRIYCAGPVSKDNLCSVGDVVNIAHKFLWCQLFQVWICLEAQVNEKNVNFGENLTRDHWASSEAVTTVIYV